MKENIQNKIRNYVDVTYNGSLKSLRDSNLHKFLTPQEVYYIRETIDPMIQTPVSLMIWCFLNDIYEQPKCPCGKDTKFDQVRKRFRPFCGEACQRTLYKQTVAKRSATNMERYGSTTYMTSEEGLKKTKEVCLEKYGVDNYSKTIAFKEAKKEWDHKNTRINN